MAHRGPDHPFAHGGSDHPFAHGGSDHPFAPGGSDHPFAPDLAYFGEAPLEETGCGEAALELALRRRDLGAAQRIFGLAGTITERAVVVAVETQDEEAIRWAVQKYGRASRRVFGMEEAWTVLPALLSLESMGSVGLQLTAGRNPGQMARLVACGAVLNSDHYAEMRTALAPLAFAQQVSALLDAGGTIKLAPYQLAQHAVLASSPPLLRRLAPLAPNFPRGAPDDIQPLFIACVGGEDLFAGSDHARDMCQILLEAGANPWLQDALGTRLSDCVWWGEYWSNSLELHTPLYVMEDNRRRIVHLLRTHMARWTPERHGFFPCTFRQRIYTFLLCNQRMRRGGRAFLVRDALRLVACALAACEAEDTHGLFRQLCTGSKQKELRAALRRRRSIDLGPKRRKADLARALVSLIPEDMACVEEDLSHQTPYPVGDIVVYDTATNSTVYSAPVPGDKPWINVGRQFVEFPCNGSTMDVSLPREFRGVSRHHLSVRKRQRDWEVYVHGKNGILLDGHNAEQKKWIRLEAPHSFQLAHTSLVVKLE